MKNFKMTGNLGADAKVTKLEKNSVIEFSMAENFTYIKNGEKVENTVWHEIKLYRSDDKTSVAQYLKKGSLIEVEGNLRYNTYTKDDKTITRAYILVDEINLLKTN